MAAQSRLRTAQDDGVLPALGASVHVMRPAPGFDLSPFNGADLHLSHTFAPDFAAWKNAGYDISQHPKSADTICVVVPRSKALARSMIATACDLGKTILVDGQKTDGIDSLFKAVRKEIGTVASVAKAHGRLFWFEASDTFADWKTPEPGPKTSGFVTTAGAFSDGAVDKGSAVLAECLPDSLKGAVADFGAGWGYLSAQVLGQSKITRLDLIEAEAIALDCAKKNVVDDRAAFHWEDATTFVGADPYDTILMNPPFHQGRSGDPSLGQAFIASAARNLKPHGQLLMVANRHLPYEATLQETFRDVKELGSHPAFKVFQASRPRR